MSTYREASLRRAWYGSAAAKRTVTANEHVGMADSAWAITSRIISGLVLYTGVGWLLSRWIGHQALLMAIGALVGLALAYYLVFTSVNRDGGRARAQQGNDRSWEDLGGK